MNQSDAKNLAEKISRTWRGGTGTEIWYDVLCDLEYGPAEVAWRQLRDTEQHQPSVAAYRSVYRAQLGTTHDPRIDCDTCGGDGWASVEYEVHGHLHQGVKPCRCAAGRETEPVHRAIIAANNAELERHGIKPAPTRPPRQDTPA